MKRLLIMALTLLTALMLNACSPAGERALRVWVGDNQDAEWINAVIAEFRAAHTDADYAIEVGVQSESDCSKIVLSDPTAAADVFTFVDDQFDSLYNGGALQQVVEGSEAIAAANGGWDSNVVKAASHGGQLYAYPATASNGYFMFYNRAYFSENDVRSLDSMLERAASAGKYLSFPMSDGWYLYAFFKGAGLEMSAGPDGVTNVCNWNAVDAPITGVQVVEALLRIAAHPGFREAGSDPFVAGIKDGSIIAGVSGVWNANVARDVWGDDYAAAKLPTYAVAGRQVQLASFAGYKLVGVNPYSENLGAAMDFAAFMTSERSQLLRFRLRSEGPSNVRAAASPEVMQNPAMAALSAQAPYSNVQRVGQKYWDAAAALGKIIVNGNPGGTALQALLDNCVAGITAPAEH